MKTKRMSEIALLLGIIITALTGFVNSTPGGGFVGATWYGYPYTWLIKMVVAPQYNPWNFDAVGLAVDIAVWSVAILTVWLVALRLMK